MKRSFAILICLILILGFCACKSTASTESQTGGEDVRNDNTSKNESVGISVPVSDVGSDKFEGEFVEIKPQCPPSYGVSF